MKKAVYGIFIAIFGLLFATVAGATPDPGSIESNAVVQNTGATDATVAVVYYDGSGTSRGTANATIAPKSVNEFKASDPSAGLPSGFQGTAVVSSDQTLAAVVSLRASGVTGSTGGVTQGAYNATVSPADTVFFPSVWGFANIGTVVSIQNTESASTDVTFNFFDRSGAALGTKVVPLSGFGSTTVDMGEAGDLPAGFPTDFTDGSITVTSSATNIAGAAHVAYANRAASYQALTTANQGTTLYGASTFSVPVGGNPSGGWNLFSATNIQNPNDQAIDVTVNYINRDDGTTTLTINCQIPANSAVGLNTNNGGSGCGTTSADFAVLYSTQADGSWAGSLEITNSQGLPMIGTGITQWGVSGYAGIFALAPASEGAETVFMPASYRRVVSGQYVQFQAVNLQNIGTTDIAASDLTIEYIDTNGVTQASFSGSAFGLNGDVLAAGSAIGLNTRNGGDLNASDFNSLGESFIGAIVITGPAGAEMIGVSNIVYSNRASSYNGVAGN